jgi:predicted nuclease of restriction endonuclease-like (RecB) superfamily
LGDEGWGTDVIGRLATDLRAEFPEMKGFSRANLFYMRRLAGEWSADAVVQQAVGQLPWGHITVLLDRLDDHGLRDWYAGRAAAHGWSRNVLEHQIRTAAHTRLRAAPTNFAEVLPPGESDLAQQITKDPYVLDFLALDGDAKERHLEQALVDRIIDTLRELGEGFAFVDDKLRRPQHADTVGLLLVADKNDAVVRYSLAGQQTPIGVASYDLLPPAVRAALPSEADLAAVLESDPAPSD